MLLLIGMDGDILVLRFKVENVGEIDAKLFAFRLDHELALSGVLFHDVGEDLAELVLPDGFGQIAQGVDFIALEGIFHMAGEKHEEDVFTAFPEPFGKGDAIRRCLKSILR